MKFDLVANVEAYADSAAFQFLEGVAIGITIGGLFFC